MVNLGIRVRQMSDYPGIQFDDELLVDVVGEFPRGQAGS